LPAAKAGITTGLVKLESGRRSKRSATPPQAAGHRIEALEAATDLAAARAQTVWVSPQTSLPSSRTRWRWSWLHNTQADCSCGKGQRGLEKAIVTDWWHHTTYVTALTADYGAA